MNFLREETLSKVKKNESGCRAEKYNYKLFSILKHL